MAISKWQPGFLYIPGSLVIPSSVAGATPTLIPNADFESGDTDWTKGTGWAINSNAFFAGAIAAEYSGPGAATIISSTKHAIEPGKSITASCFVSQGASEDDQANAAIILRWYDSLDAFISDSTGNSVASGEVGVWRKSSVSAVAPPGSAKVSIGAYAYNDWAALYVDTFAWNYVTGAAAAALAYEATQTEAGYSSHTEPVWPTVIGNTVVDKDITWTAVEVDSVTWEASSVLTSGSSEPTWPTGPGDYISDNNIAWETTPLRIEDENCPHTKVVAIAASKVFAGDVDITRFCATLNARDWSSEDDAGFLPTGLQQKSQVGVEAMGVYRGNLAIWSGSTFQVWQVDPDPAAMALLDAMEGIGSMHQQAVQPVSDDLFFLAALGVRTVSIAEGANNLASGDVGVPIDTLVQAEANYVDVEPIASYYPSGGQYWLAFRPKTIIAAVLAGQFLLTSPIYPIEGTDSLAWGTSVVGASLAPFDPENVTTDLVPQSITIDNILIDGSVPEENVTTDLVPQLITIDTILLSGSVPEENVTMDFVPQSIEVDGILVTHDNPADTGLDWSTVVISATLT